MQRTLLLPLICLTATPLIAAPAKTEHLALYTGTPVKIDGKLDEPVWKQAKAYPMYLAVRPTDPDRDTAQLTEGAKVQLAWDDDYLYLAAELDDSDVVAEVDEDNAHHYRSGDVLELFLRPPGKRHYWELYGVPNGRQTTFFYHSRGRTGLPGSLITGMGMKVAAEVHGTLNDDSDKDKGWTLEMAVPRKALAAGGAVIDVDAPAWQILVSRYNYSVYHEVQGGELSTTSEEPSPTFHDFKHWGTLRFIKPENQPE